ncbi:MAG: hypothetical protein D6795_07055 [Deltaproteobacteria bacterium]|nr:MAG: hypothetical protein D6795_07055 [Deltaproteobacteria bacterium]
MIAILSRPATQRDPDLLRDIFSISFGRSSPSLRTPKPASKGNEKQMASGALEAEIPGILGKNGTLVLGKVPTGFRLRGRMEEEAPRRIEVQVAYDVLRGDAFRRYSPFDFQMDRVIAVKLRGARVVARYENRLELEIEAPEFEVLVTRFDEKRDLRVKVQPLEEER